MHVDAAIDTTLLMARYAHTDLEVTGLRLEVPILIRFSILIHLNRSTEDTQSCPTFLPCILMSL